jgi:hypothetical protein
MSRANHTAGTWIITHDANYGAELAIDSIVDGDTVHIALVHGVGTDEETQANADLIAASPLLLTALKDLLVECDRHGFAEVSLDHPMVKPFFDAARAAIATAEGLR